ncbi:HAMP domain-containing methyl-accepting chemotaxis protein [Hoeflea sp. YIM 152468]|uniref:methyl-accepting chemotaxis protein n=1 Tax=Hoeflea sp. YIM 152468 TaxID=3031759 RepID=UPI0023D97A6E|nr:HAMP domain-containing methyl-accepting chemotaxis protein [Hoeflea sp. YIM 152468]MDF1610154.1 HAMP domain-containing methyl-accepting chemotaxis protein [Hoeflea sp. YIM 152468]
MSIDKLLARFSIQTKVIVLVMPLVAGMVGLAAINLYTGSLLGGRLTGTSASIETLSGFKEAYAGMTNFLHDQNEEKRDSVMQSLDAQLGRMEKVLMLAENQQESDALGQSRQLAEALRGDVDSLWLLHGEVTGLRAGFADTLTELGEVRNRLNRHIETVGQGLADAENETKTMLRSADNLTGGATTVVEIATAINAADTPEAAFEAAEALKRDIRKMQRDLPKAIPDTKPALKSLIVDNMGGLLDTLKTGNVGPAGMIELQKFAGGLRPTGIQLQGLASQFARAATLRFGELDQQILQGQQIISDSRDFLARLSALELAIVHFLGMPDEISGENVAAKLSRVDQSIQLIAFSDGGETVLEAIGQAWSAKSVTIPALMAELIAKREAETALFAAASDRINQAWSGVLSFTSSQQQGAEAVKQRANGITLSAAAIGGLFGLLAAFLLITALKGPITRLVGAMRDVASGDLDVDVTDNARADEIGEMARALDVFKSNAIDKIRVEDESNRTREMAEQARQQSDTEKAESDAQLRFAVDALGAALRDLSQGNLVSTIDTPFTGELDRLRLDFNESIEQMRDTLSRIRDNAGSIQSGSAQMRSAADDLSRRTEQQAASLEETAAAVDQISATVRAASGRAAETDKLAGDTASDARASGEVVARAVDAMSRIEDASGKITQIIGVIDEIAFQTNLLALNAGVEAARAGEAGRGFAVVAQEVRELAGRSATAAKEIKDLIARSGEEVRSGVSLVGETGEAITRIITRIEEISGHVGAMATASREQATGLGEVNSAVNQMDQMTQQNAAMVEQTNASSHTLAQEAAELAAMVARFRLDIEDARRQAESHAA